MDGEAVHNLSVSFLSAPNEFQFKSAPNDSPLLDFDDEFVLLFAHDEDRARRLAQDVFGDAAKREALEAGVTVGSHHDQVGRFAFRCLADAVGGASGQDLRGDVKVRVEFGSAKTR